MTCLFLAHTGMQWEILFTLLLFCNKMEIHDSCMTILVLLLSFAKSFCQTGRFDPVPDGKECPATSKEWRKLAAARNCPDSSPYHCIKNQYQEFGEVCVRQSWVYSGQCPIYDTERKQIDLKPCQPFDGYVCPTTEFLSNNVYINEICLRMPKPTTTTAVSPDAGKTTTSPSSSQVGPIVAVVLILVVLVVAVLVWFFYLRRRYNLQIPLPFTKRKITICAKTPVESDEVSDPERKQLISNGMEKEIQRSNPCFVETHIYRDIIRMLKKHNVVLVVGKTGIGKSATCVGVLEYYRDRLEWKAKHFPTDTEEKLEEKTIVLVDITFGDIPLYSRYDSNIDEMLNRLYTSTRDCREFKVLITSSSPLTSEINIPILKGCAKFDFENIQYKKEDLKKMFERYMRRSSKIENKTGWKSYSMEQTYDSVMSNHDVQQNDVHKEQLEVKGNKDISTDCRTDQRNSSQNLCDSPRSWQSETGYSDRGNVKQVVDKSAEENSQREEIISKEEYIYKIYDVKCVPGKEETEATATSRTENITGKCHLPLQEIGDLNQSRNYTAISVADTSLEPELQIEEEEETLKKANISEFGLPAVCYLHLDFQGNVQSYKKVDLISDLEDYVLSLAESNNPWERQRYGTLVFIMLMGSTYKSGPISQGLLRCIDQSLSDERILAHAYQMVEEGILQRIHSPCSTTDLKDGIMKETKTVFSFSNDVLLFVVIKSFVTRNIQTFLQYCYLPFIMQFLQPKEQPDCLSIQLGGDKAFLVEIGTGCAKRYTAGNDFKDLPFLDEFKRRLRFHEDETTKYFKIDQDKEDEKKGNIFVRKMINHHPYLKEYYKYAEPDKFQSIPKDGFQQEVKDHPTCCQSQELDDF